MVKNKTKIENDLVIHVSVRTELFGMLKPTNSSHEIVITFEEFRPKSAECWTGGLQRNGFRAKEFLGAL